MRAVFAVLRCSQTRVLATCLVFLVAGGWKPLKPWISPPRSASSPLLPPDGGVTFLLHSNYMFAHGQRLDGDKDSVEGHRDERGEKIEENAMNVEQSRQPSGKKQQQKVMKTSKPPKLPVKPNLVVIGVDGLTTDLIGAYNSSMQKHTRNLNDFASNGVLFEHASSNAGSTPSRVSLLTGRQSLRSGLVSSSKFLLSFFSPAQPGMLPDEVETLPEILKADPNYGKYVTGHIGTWHLGVGGQNGTGLPLHHGFDKFFGTPTPPSLEPCDNGMGWEDAVKSVDKYGNPIGLQTKDDSKLTANQKDGVSETELADDEEWIDDDDMTRDPDDTHAPSRDYGLSFWAFWSLSSLLWQSMVLGLVIVWFANGVSSLQCGVCFFVIISVALIPFIILDNLSMSDPNSCILIRGNKVVEQPLRMGSYASRVTDEAMHFLESQMVCSRHRCLERDSFMLSVSYALPPPRSIGALWDGITRMGAKADAVAEIDHHIGVLLKKIGHLGLRSRTLVIITGYAPDYFHRSKGGRPMRVPLMASLEGYSHEGKRVQMPVDLVDVVPTFLELAEVSPKYVMDGKSLWSFFMDAHIKSRLTKKRIQRMKTQMTSRVVPHYCGDSVVGLSKGKYTIMFEGGDGSHACKGSPYNPPLFCDRSLRPQCEEWIKITSQAPKEVTSAAFELLDVWKAIEARVSVGDPGMRTVTEWPVPAFYPCCRNLDNDTVADGILGTALEYVHLLLGGRSSHCGCSIDVPPKKGQAPRAKPKTSYRPQYNPGKSTS